MITVFNNADFISFDENNITYTTMVVKGREIVYLGYNTPLCYEGERVADLGGKAVVPLINPMLEFNVPQAVCTKLAPGESADFAVVNKNILKDNHDVRVFEIYLRGKKKPF